MTFDFFIHFVRADGAMEFFVCVFVEERARKSPQTLFIVGMVHGLNDLCAIRGAEFNLQAITAHNYIHARSIHKFTYGHLFGSIWIQSILCV